MGATGTTHVTASAAWTPIFAALGAGDARVFSPRPPPERLTQARGRATRAAPFMCILQDKTLTHGRVVRQPQYDKVVRAGNPSHMKQSALDDASNPTSEHSAESMVTTSVSLESKPSTPLSS